MSNDTVARTSKDVLRGVQAELIKIAAGLVQGTHIPIEFNEDNFYKSTPVAERRRIRKAIERLEEHGRVTGIKLRQLFDKLSPLIRSSDETGARQSEAEREFKARDEVELGMTDDEVKTLTIAGLREGLELIQEERVKWAKACQCDCTACESFHDVVSDIEDATALKAVAPPPFAIGTHVRFIDSASDHAEWVVYRLHDGWVHLHVADDRTCTHFAKPEQLRAVKANEASICACGSAKDPKADMCENCYRLGENGSER